MLNKNNNKLRYENTLVEKRLMFSNYISKIRSIFIELNKKEVRQSYVLGLILSIDPAYESMLILISTMFFLHAALYGDPTDPEDNNENKNYLKRIGFFAAAVIGGNIGFYKWIKGQGGP